MQLLLDTTEYSKKPQGREIGAISKRIIEHETNIDARQLAQEVEKGKTFAPAIFKSVDGKVRRSKENWESQQVIALDFDEGMTLREAWEDDFFQTYAVFLYTTFSHTEEHHKFRVVFVLDEPVTQYKHFEAIMTTLLERYPYADQACKDGSRLFFGGKKVIPFEYENRLVVDDLINITPLQDIKDNIDMSCKKVRTSPEACNSTIYTNNANLIRDRNIKKLQEQIEIEPVTLSNNEVFDYLKKQDLRAFLGIEVQGNFIDIFHEEGNPSASIYQSHNSSGHWLYKCHSTSSSFTGTIFHVVQRLLNCSVIEAKQFLLKLYRIEIYESEAVKEFKESIDMYKELLRSDLLEEVHPHFYKVFNRYGYLQGLYMLLDLSKEYITNDSTPSIVFYHSIRTLAEHFGRSTSATGTRMNFFTLFNLIRKLDEKEIPESLLGTQNKNKRKNHFQYRNSTYEFPIYSYDFFCRIDDMCKIWLEKGCTSRTISYEGIMRTFGRQKADRVFPQDKGKEIAELNEEVVSQIHLTLLRLIEDKDWATEKEALDKLLYYFKGQQEFKTRQFKRCIGEMIDMYGLEIVSTNKRIKEEMGITEDHMSIQSFPKIIRPKKDLAKDGTPQQGTSKKVI